MLSNLAMVLCTSQSCRRQARQVRLFLCFGFLLGFLNQPVDGQEDDHEGCSPIKPLHRNQWGICSGIKTVKGDTQIPNQAEDVDCPEGIHADAGAQVKRYGDQQDKVEGNHPNPNPQRSIRRKEGDQDLQRRIGQVTVKGQNKDVEQGKPNGKQGDELVKVKGITLLQYWLNNSGWNGQSPNCGQP